VHHYEIANEGRNNLLFVFGDSHAEKITHRFKKLFEDSKENNKTDTFPTIVALIRRGTNLTNVNPLLETALHWMHKHKPQRVFLGCFWAVYLVKNMVADQV